METILYYRHERLSSIINKSHFIPSIIKNIYLSGQKGEKNNLIGFSLQIYGKIEYMSLNSFGSFEIQSAEFVFFVMIYCLSELSFTSFKR